MDSISAAAAKRRHSKQCDPINNPVQFTHHDCKWPNGQLGCQIIPHGLLLFPNRTTKIIVLFFFILNCEGAEKFLSNKQKITPSKCTLEHCADDATSHPSHTQQLRY